MDRSSNIRIVGKVPLATDSAVGICVQVIWGPVLWGTAPVKAGWDRGEMEL